MDCSRQELVLGKNELNKKKAAIIGLGAIGSNSANMLARSGLNLVLIDNDKVEAPNINSQSVYCSKDINKPKAMALAGHLMEINKKIKYCNERINKKNINLIKADLVLDCTDNMETRFLLSDYCKKQGMPLVHSAAIKMIGTVFIVHADACLRCIYSNESIVEDCSTAGILNSTANVIAGIQCSEALKILTNRPYEKNLLRINLESNEIIKVKVKKKCEMCMNSKKEMKNKLIINKCRDKGGYSVKQEKQKSLSLKSMKDNFNVIAETPIVIVIKDKCEIIVHSYGELIFKNMEDMDYIKKMAERIYEKG